MALCPCHGGEARVCQACVDAYSAEISRLRATIAEQAATIARLAEALKSAKAILDGEMGDWADAFGADWDVITAALDAVDRQGR